MGLGWGHKKNLMLVLKNHRRKFLTSFEYSSDRIFKSKEGGGHNYLRVSYSSLREFLMYCKKGEEYV